jgi:hypothetical protein
MVLHEIELFSADPEKDKNIFQDILGLKLHVDQQDLNVYSSGQKGLDLDVSIHYPDVKVSLAFLVSDVDKYFDLISNKGLNVSEPCDSHLGLKEIKFCTSEGIQIIIHSPTDQSPEWINDMVKKII